ncbi:hypothetical protein [Planomicrobium sp. CPCC 101110]|uniref:hypothetical protein n=1 Tax=Planomicrobium sp. CPCC 101110 TaxID=2599619 RepID=UPI00351AF456
MQKLGNLLIVVGIVLIGYFVYESKTQEMAQSESLEKATETIEQAQSGLEEREGPETEVPEHFKADPLEAFGILEIPKLDKALGNCGRRGC